MTCLSVDENIRYVAEYLKSEIIKQSKDLPEVGWPPTFDELSDVRLKSPECVTTFLQFLLQKNSTDYPNTNRLVNSFAQDLVRGVTNGKIILAKHFLIALGLHNMTGQKQVVDILHRLGHSNSYSQMCEIETAQAEAAIERSMSSSILSLKPPQNSDGFILTYFWVDNFDMKIDNQTGGGMINITTLVAFQEESDISTLTPPERMNLPKHRRLTMNEPNQLDVYLLTLKRNHQSF